MHRRLETEARGRSRHVVHLAVGNHDHAGKPVWRHVGKRLREVGEQHGAVTLAVRRGRVRIDPAHLEVGEGLEPLLQFLAQLGGARGAAGDGLALAVVDHHGEHVVERLAVLLLQLRIGEGEQQQRVAQQPEDSAAPRAPKQQREQHRAQAGERPQYRPGHEGKEFDRPAHGVTAPTARAGQGRAPDRPCSCR